MPPLGEREGLVIEPAVAAASQCLASGDTEGALALLSPLVTADAPSLAARFLLAHTAWKMDRLDWALELARACHEAAPMDGAVAETLASLYAQCGDPVESVYFGKLATALGSASDLASLVPKGFPTFERAFAAINESPRLARARAELAAGKLGEAVESVRQHVALDPGDADGRAFHAALLLRVDRPCDAVAELRPIEQEVQKNALFATLYAQCLTAAGAFADARRWHEAAAALAPDDALVAAARIADGTWLDDEPLRVVLGGQWASRHGAPRRARLLRDPDGPLVIAYLVPALVDRGDAAAIAAVAAAHERVRTKVIAYANGARSWLENATLSGAFDVWQDVGELDPPTIARYFRHDGVDVVIDAAGFAAPSTLIALSQCATALRVSWLGNPAALGAPVYDARILARRDSLPADAWGIAGGYPILGARRQADRAPRPHIQFGSDASLAQLDRETVSCWVAILAAMPGARLVLRGHDSGAGTVDRLVERFGREAAARIDLVSAERFEEFYALVDVVLAPRRGASPRMAAEAAACGVPVVAFTAAPYGSFLEGIGRDAGAVATDAADYVLCAAAQAQKLLQAPAADDAASFAAAIEEHARHALRQVACP